jgi:hypothetical protein
MAAVADDVRRFVDRQAGVAEALAGAVDALADELRHAGASATYCDRVRDKIGDLLLGTMVRPTRTLAEVEVDGFLHGVECCQPVIVTLLRHVLRADAALHEARKW